MSFLRRPQKSFSFTCSCCGDVHSKMPDLCYSQPSYWDPSEAEKDPERNWLTSDLCVLGEHRFIRCVLRVPIRGYETSLGWGVWLSQSEDNFRRYAEAPPNAGGEETFGYFSNRLSGYPDTLGLHAMAEWQDGNNRPLVALEPVDHPLYWHWSQGMPLEQAVALVEKVFHPSN